jgi:hypothetical protein
VAEFCPRVAVVRPGICAIGARGPARYFGGEAGLANRISAALARRELGCQIGVADGLFAALLAARMARRGSAWPVPSGTMVPAGETAAFLASLPVTALDVPELDDLLSRLGIHTLGEFAALPAAEAASRFGTQGALAHRLASGLDPGPLVPRPAPVDLSVKREFDPPAQQTEPVIFAAKALADQLHADLAARGLGCVRIRVQAVCADGQENTRLWRHDGLLSALAVAERVRWQLDGWRPGQNAAAGAAASADPAQPDPARADPGLADPGLAGAALAGGALAGGVTLLRLIPDQLVRATGRQLGLWGDATVSDRVARAAVRVQALLGHTAVTRPVLAGGRGPAEQALLVPFGDAELPRLPPDRPWPARIPPPAPATVYSEPRQARVTDDSGIPVTVSGRVQVSGLPARLAADGSPALAVTSWAGPWPVTERWWDPPRARRQARFQLVTEDGSAWQAVVQDGGWLIEASYDLIRSIRAPARANFYEPGFEKNTGLSVPADTIIETRFDSWSWSARPAGRPVKEVTRCSITPRYARQASTPGRRRGWPGRGTSIWKSCWRRSPSGEARSAAPKWIRRKCSRPRRLRLTPAGRGRWNPRK